MIITQTPLRISLAGGGTDFRDHYLQHGGAVVSSAIDKYVYVIIKERFDELIIVNYSKKEIRETVGDVQHELVRGAMEMTGISHGVEITTLADIPSQGSGLGSSSSVTVGLLHACHAYRGTLVDAERLAREACEIEIDRAQKPIGVQDQYIAAFGHLRLVVFEPGGAVSARRLGMSESLRRKLGGNLLLFYTGRTRSSASILEEQKARVNANKGLLDRLKAIALELAESLERGEADAVGWALRESWDVKRALASGITDSSLDQLVQRAMKAGAVGGKIAGAGGGGFLLLYVPGPLQDQVRQALPELRELPFHLERDGSKVIFSLRGYETK
ncbi:GHMP kinase [Candidatus Fermentibacteria bacterium]|nr:GHMP kinase [Candidatus Fermentibacteria bacterium]